MNNICKGYYRSPIGTLEIIGSRDGVSSILFVDDDVALGSIPTCLEECALQLDDYFAGRRVEFSFPLDLQGTEFQKRVWRELQKIPFGKTVSYLEVALAVGTREATRAVGRANGQNPIVIVIPCHRVIGRDGSLTGYGGGVWRKRWLLDFESPARQTSLFAIDVESNASHG
ncbi:MAG TPA: methylated-DNA--[protein]-cysteine S-methyltransferase [Anaerolineae bacterium]